MGGGGGELLNEKDRDACQKFKEELLRDTKISNGEET